MCIQLHVDGWVGFGSNSPSLVWFWLALPLPFPFSIEKGPLLLESVTFASGLVANYNCLIALYWSAVYYMVQYLCCVAILILVLLRFLLDNLKSSCWSILIAGMSLFRWYILVFMVRVQFLPNFPRRIWSWRKNILKQKYIIIISRICTDRYILTWDALKAENGFDLCAIPGVVASPTGCWDVDEDFGVLHRIT